MKPKHIAGMIILAILFLALIAVTVYTYGWKPAMIIWTIGILVSALIIFAAWLLGS